MFFKEISRVKYYRWISIIPMISFCTILLVFCLSVSSCKTFAEEKEDSDNFKTTLSVSDLQDDFRDFRTFIEESHPQLYRFTSKAVFDSLFDAHYLSIDHPMTIQEFYTVLIPLVARVGCGHTSLWAPSGFWNNAPQAMFPFRLHAQDGKLHIIRSYNSELLIKPGSRILSINGEPAEDLVTELCSNIWSDGFIETKRYRRLNTVFPYLYALTYGFPDQYEIVFEEDGIEKQLVVDPVSRSAVDMYTDSLFIPGGARNAGLKTKVLEGKTAILTIGSFAYYDDNKGFNSFIDSSFKEFRDHDIQHLIIDLRGNDGGDPFCSSHLLRYLQKEPVVYFKEPYGQYARLNKPLSMADQPFEGKQYYLIDGICFSTTGHITSLLKYHRLGTFIGEEAGATFTCNDASHDMILKNTGYRIQSARRSFATMVSGFPLDQGIMPDHHVQPSVEEVIRGHDTVMEYALQLISGNSYLYPGNQANEF